jgi:BASS family bile acid:Na+ symporter
MIVIDGPFAALAWLGRQGTRAVAASVFLGLAVPQLAAFVKPYLGPTVFVLLTLSILRVDVGHLRDYFRAPRLILAATLWIMIVSPLVLGGLLYVSGLREWQPDLFLVLILQVAATPITSAPAFAALMGLDVALSFGILIVCTFVTWLTTPGFAYLWAGSALISPVDLGLRSLLFYSLSIAAAALLFWWFGKPAIDRKKDYIDGFNVIALFAFAVAAMDGVAAQVVARPLFALILLGVAFGLTALMIVLTALAFRAFGREEALIVGAQAGSRNLGVLVGIIGVSAIPPDIWLYFALCQFPIYLMPQILKRFSRTRKST